MIDDGSQQLMDTFSQNALLNSRNLNNYRGYDVQKELANTGLLRAMNGQYALPDFARDSSGQGMQQYQNFLNANTGDYENRGTFDKNNSLDMMRNGTMSNAALGREGYSNQSALNREGFENQTNQLRDNFSGNDYMMRDQFAGNSALNRDNLAAQAGMQRDRLTGEGSMLNTRLGGASSILSALFGGGGSSGSGATGVNTNYGAGVQLPSSGSHSSSGGSGSSNAGGLSSAFPSYSPPQFGESFGFNNTPQYQTGPMFQDHKPVASQYTAPNINYGSIGSSRPDLMFGTQKDWQNRNTNMRPGYKPDGTLATATGGYKR